jgi:hypothetical protein
MIVVMSMTTSPRLVINNDNNNTSIYDWGWGGTDDSADVGFTGCNTA